MTHGQIASLKLFWILSTLSLTLVGTIIWALTKLWASGKDEFYATMSSVACPILASIIAFAYVTYTTENLKNMLLETKNSLAESWNTILRKCRLKE
jgi:hypothetical protein